MQYRLVIALPGSLEAALSVVGIYASSFNLPFTKTYTAVDNAIESIEVTLKRGEKGMLSYMTVSASDPRGAVFNRLPDPAFSDVPITLSLTTHDSAQSFITFDGYMTALEWQSPSNKLQIVGHDQSILMRRRAKYRTFKGLTPVQIATNICQDYGIGVDVSGVGPDENVQRVISIGHPPSGDSTFSDWNHIVR